MASDEVRAVLRTDYAGSGLGEEQLAATPFQQISRWVEEARARQEEQGDVPEPDALSVATVDEDGPDVRTVLMRFLDPRGPGFVTNLQSTKGRQLAGNPRIAASLTWPSMFRAVRFRGTAELVDRAEVETYFQQRPWGSRVSAWASDQSQPAGGREQLEATYAEYAARFPDHGRPEDVPVPEHWGAVRVRADQVEFWAGRINRLHDRLVLARVGDGDLDDAASWAVTRLQP
ncbi:pyridoxamine 5'-phosphate oxidase [Ornithinimicrobium faecis]|uniref:Pyridoxamine 5'-phosphate oxidase n=1 Tax=Ornithinimicrobium faecis TaxID=2934158 RepID=A0ABY4YSR2_9MICO|nr:pyridoxamine 5'-phosphate oxidase [Ornithinimicrobium sp. HY1793]USQ79530.1 pyridoxamine 5'-phosphate oxidase [Ornithinimicrobium sp. HY1793]